MRKILVSSVLAIVLVFALTLPASAKGASGVKYAPVASGSLAAPLSKHGEKYALCIGIADYPGTSWDLSYCERDASLMRDVLVGDYGFDPANVKLVTSKDAAYDWDYASVVQDIKDFVTLASANPGNEMVFYYSGHGQKGKYPGSLDNSEKMNECIILPYGDGLKYLWDVELAGLFSGAACRSIFIFDSCHSGGMENLAGTNRIIVGACRETSMCDENARYDSHGQFTYLFAEQAIQKGLANGLFKYTYAPAVSIEEAFDYVRVNEQSQVATLFDGVSGDTLF